jgi:hypothetical protein
MFQFLAAWIGSPGRLLRTFLPAAFVVGAFSAPSAAPVSPAIPGLHLDGSLDREKVHEMYMNGDFDKVSDVLEEYRKAHDSLDQDEKIFVYKYLGVIYCSNPKTRPKGEAFLFSLLQLVPTITLLDMYISDAVESIFDRVRERYAQLAIERRRDADNYRTPSKPSVRSGAEPAKAAPEPRPAAQVGTETQSWAWVYWAAGGAAVASAVAVYWLASDEKAEDERYVLKRP